MTVSHKSVTNHLFQMEISDEKDFKLVVEWMDALGKWMDGSQSEFAEGYRPQIVTDFFEMFHDQKRWNDD